MIQPLKIAVLMGGTSFERDFSLASGRNIVRTLESAGHTVLPLDTSPTLVATLREQEPDVVYSALHGNNGEDGTIQSLLEFLHIPYVGQSPNVCRLGWVKAVLPHVVMSYRRALTGGSAVVCDAAASTGVTDASTACVNKLKNSGVARADGASGEAAVFKNPGVSIPSDSLPESGSATVVDKAALTVLSTGLTADATVWGEALSGPAAWPEYLALNAASFKEMGAATALDLIPQWFAKGYPLAVKPMRGGSAMGVAKVEDQSQLAAALLDALSFDDEVFIEEWIRGTELAVAVIGSGKDARALPPVEIAPREGFFSTEARLDSALVEYFSPPRLVSLNPDKEASQAALKEITAAALEVHRAFGCRDLSRIDLVWDGKKPRVLEINTSPGMTEYSLVPMACAAANLPLAELLEDLLRKAIAR